jgi:hypothetical protein
LGNHILVFGKAFKTRLSFWKGFQRSLIVWKGFQKSLIVWKGFQKSLIVLESLSKVAYRFGNASQIRGTNLKSKKLYDTLIEETTTQSNLSRNTEPTSKNG